MQYDFTRWNYSTASQNALQKWSFSENGTEILDYFSWIQMSENTL